MRRLISVLSLSSYLVTSIGVPLPRRAEASDGKPFPCQGHACGCGSAAQCWKQCCCYTPRQKLAWAIQNQVEPPASLVAEVGADDQRDSIAAPAKKCCTHHAAHERKSHECCEGEEKTVEQVVLIEPLARRCRGLVDLLCLTAVVGPLPRSIDWQFAPTVVEWLSLPRLLLLGAELSPPVPPPRV